MDGLTKHQSFVQKYQDKSEDEFNSIYKKFLNYLRSIDFESIFPNPKTTLSNYTDLSKENTTIQNGLSDDQISSIIDYIKRLSASPYKKYTLEKKIPILSCASENSDSNIKSEDNNQQEKNKTDIKLMTYIKELLNKYLVYNDESIRNYHINLCATILLQYCQSHPLELTKIHFRFKSPKGLVEKLAKTIIRDGHFEIDPDTQIGIFKYQDISDAFGAKIVSEKGFSPRFTSDSEISGLISEKEKHLSEIEKYEIFNEKINEIISNNLGVKSQITYGEYLDNCIEILKKHIKLLNPKAQKLIESLNSKIEYLEEYKQIIDASSDLNDIIDDYEIFENPDTNYRQFYSSYISRIPSKLTLAGLRKGLNNIFNNNGQTQKDILAKNILASFNARVINIENKDTSSGHQAIHYDILTPYGKMELQAQDTFNYELDRIGDITAHSLMKGKGVPLLPIPKPYNISDFSNKNDFINITSPSMETQYYKRSEIEKFIKNVENITAKKGKISHNLGLDNAQIDLYSPYYNYYALAMEIPDSHPKKKLIENYFSNFQRKSFALPPMFRAKTQYLNFSQIKSKLLHSNIPEK